MYEQKLTELIERQMIIGAYLRRYLRERKRAGVQRMNYHAVQVLRQSMALDAQIKRLCAIDLDGQRARLEVETQLAEQFNCH